VTRAATGRPHVVVLGGVADPPPGLEILDSVAEVAAADTSDELAGVIGDAEVVFAWRPDGELLSSAWEKAGSVRWIQTASAGVDRILFPELVQTEVVLTNAAGIFDDAIAEWVLGSMLVFAKGLIGVLDRQRRREWRHHETEVLTRKKVLIAGVGGIGRAVARRCHATGMRVRGVGRTARPGDEPFEIVLGTDELPDAVTWADYVVDALPATPATRAIFDREVFSEMRPNARFINVGRGSTVDEAALVEALRDAYIAGAALDVFEQEPLSPSSPLWDMPNVIVSPHMSGDFAGYRIAVVELFLENLGRYVEDKPLKNVVDKRLGFPARA
jgi:phosphoglycerate dehydrogenase-like enzyme